MLRVIVVTLLLVEVTLSCDCFPGECDSSEDCHCDRSFTGPSCSTILQGVSVSECRIEYLNNNGESIGKTECGHEKVTSSFEGVTKVRVRYSTEENQLNRFTQPPTVTEYEFGVADTSVQLFYKHVPDRNCSNGRQEEYRGLLDTTESGKQCQEWTSKFPHIHTYSPTRYPDAGLGQHSFCRNPGGEDRAWCFTREPLTRWEYCNLPFCTDIYRKDYMIFKEEAVFSMANEKCLQRGMGLALPRNKYENDKLRDGLKAAGVGKKPVLIRGFKSQDTWADPYSRRNLDYANWDAAPQHNEYLAATLNGGWISVSKDSAHWFACESRDGAVATDKQKSNCSSTFNLETRNSYLNCTAEVVVPRILHNMMWTVRITTKTGGHKDVEKGASQGYHFGYEPVSDVLDTTFLVDRNAPVHCSLVGMCKDKELWNIFDSFLESGTFLMDVTGWMTFDAGDTISKYVVTITTLVPNADESKVIRGRVIFSRTFFSETIFYQNVRPGYYLVELEVYDSHGNSQVSRKLLLYSPSPQISLDVRNPVRVTDAFGDHWITDSDTRRTVSWTGHFFVSDFKYFPERYSIQLPVVNDRDVAEEYDHHPVNENDLSFDGLRHSVGLVNFEYQWTKGWQPSSSHWILLEDLSTKLTFQHFGKSKLWIRGTDVFGKAKIISHDIYATGEAPHLRNFRLTPNPDYNSVDLSQLCFSLEGHDPAAGIMSVKAGLQRRGDLLHSHSFPPHYCQGEVPSYCQCNQAGVCTRVPYTLCFDQGSITAQGQPGSTYVIRVAITSFANITTTAKLKFVLDTSPPSAGSLRKVKSYTDRDFSSVKDVSVYFVGAHDTETEVAEYMLMSTENLQNDVTPELIMEHGQTKSGDGSFRIPELRPLRPTRFCGVVRNTAGIISAPVCSSPVVLDTTAPELKYLSLMKTYTQPGLAFDGSDFWRVEPNGTKTHVNEDCSYRGIRPMELAHYPTNRGILIGDELCKLEEFDGTTLLLSPSVFEIRSRFKDVESGISKVRVTVSVTKGGSYYDYVTAAREYDGSPDRIIIDHSDDITWYTPRFYVNVMAYNHVNHHRTFSIGPCYFYDDEDYYDGRRGVSFNETGLWMDFEKEKFYSDFDYRANEPSVFVRLQTTSTGSVVLDFTPAEIRDEQAWIAFSTIKPFLVPNQELELKAVLRIITPVGKSLIYESDNSVRYTLDTYPPSAGFVLDGATDIDIDFQTSRVIAGSWFGIPAGYNCEAGISTDSARDDVWRFEEVSVPGSLAVALPSVSGGRTYFVLLKCKGNGGTPLLLSSDGVTIVSSRPVLRRAYLNTAYGFDFNYLAASWRHDRLFENVPQELEYSVRRNGHQHLPTTPTDTSTHFTSTSLLPPKSNLTVHLELRELNQIIRTVSAPYVIDGTSPFVSGNCLSDSSSLSLYSGTRVYHDKGCLKVRLYARDIDSSISSTEVYFRSKDRVYDLRYMYTSPHEALVCSDALQHGDRFDPVVRAVNGAGLSFSRGCGTVTIATENPAVATLIDQLNRTLLVRSSDKVELLLGGTIPFVGKPQTLTTTSLIDMGPSDGFISYRTVSDLHLKSPWEVRKVQAGYLIPVSCQDLRLCGRDQYGCSDTMQCPFSSRNHDGVQIRGLYSNRYLHSNTVVEVSWDEEPLSVFTEVSIIRTSNYRTITPWKVVVKDTSVTIPVELEEGTEYRVLVAHHYNGTTIVLASRDFFSSMLAPTVNPFSPPFFSVPWAGAVPVSIFKKGLITWNNTCSASAEVFHVAVGRCKGCSDVMDWKRYANQTWDAFSAEDLPSGTRLFLTLICYNRAGLGSRVAMETPVTVDNDPPVVPNDIAHRWTPPGGIEFTWVGAYDVDTEVTSYSAFLLDRNGTVLSEVKTLTEDHHVFGTETLRSDTFRVEVEVHDRVGNTAKRTSQWVEKIGSRDNCTHDLPKEVNLSEGESYEFGCLRIIAKNYIPNNKMDVAVEIEAGNYEFSDLLLFNYNKKLLKKFSLNIAEKGKVLALQINHMDLIRFETVNHQRIRELFETSFLVSKG